MTTHYGEATMKLAAAGEDMVLRAVAPQIEWRDDVTPPVQDPGPRDWACISRMGGFGDNLIATAVLPGLKRRYGRVEVITGEPMHVMFENNPYIDKLSVYPKDKSPLSPTGTWNEYYNLRACEYRFFANLSHSCEATGVFMRAQTQFYWPDEMRRKLCSRSYLQIVADICNLPFEEMEPGFFPTHEEELTAFETLAKVGPKRIGWVISGSRLDKSHPQADVIVARLIKELEIPVVMFGGPGRDYEYARLIQKEVHKRNGSLDGLHLALSGDPDFPTWGPRRICATLQQCDIVVGPDTGPMWAVAMKEIPKVLLASHAGGSTVTMGWKNTVTLEADRTRVPCYPCHRLHDDASMCKINAEGNGAACISDITPDTIIETVRKLTEG